MINLKQNKEIKTTTYNIESDIYNGFILEVEEKDDIFDVWLYHGGHGVKDYMFGLPKDNPESADLDGCLEIVKSNLPSYVATYIDLYI